MAAFQNVFRFLGSSINQHFDDGADFGPALGCLDRFLNGEDRVTALIHDVPLAFFV